MNIIESCTSTLGSMSAICPALQSGASTLASWGSTFVTGVANTQEYLRRAGDSLTSNMVSARAVKKLAEHRIIQAAAGQLPLTVMAATTPIALPVACMLYSIGKRTFSQNNQRLLIDSLLKAEKTNDIQRQSAELSQCRNFLQEEVKGQAKLANREITPMYYVKHLLTALFPIAIAPQVCAVTSTLTPVAGFLPAAIPVLCGLSLGGLAWRYLAEKADRLHEQKTIRETEAQVEMLTKEIEKLDTQIALKIENKEIKTKLKNKQQEVDQLKEQLENTKKDAKQQIANLEHRLTELNKAAEKSSNQSEQLQ